MKTVKVANLKDASTESELKLERIVGVYPADNTGKTGEAITIDPSVAGKVKVYTDETIQGDGSSEALGLERYTLDAAAVDALFDDDTSDIAAELEISAVYFDADDPYTITGILDNKNPNGVMPTSVRLYSGTNTSKPAIIQLPHRVAHCGHYLVSETYVDSLGETVETNYFPIDIEFVKEQETGDNVVVGMAYDENFKTYDYKTYLTVSKSGERCERYVDYYQIATTPLFTDDKTVQIPVDHTEAKGTYYRFTHDGTYYIRPISISNVKAMFTEGGEQVEKDVYTYGPVSEWEITESEGSIVHASQLVPNDYGMHVEVSGVFNHTGNYYFEYRYAGEADVKERVYEDYIHTSYVDCKGVLEDIAHDIYLNPETDYDMPNATSPRDYNKEGNYDIRIVFVDGNKETRSAWCPSRGTAGTTPCVNVVNGAAFASLFSVTDEFVTTGENAWKLKFQNEMWKRVYNNVSRPLKLRYASIDMYYTGPTGETVHKYTPVTATPTVPVDIGALAGYREGTYYFKVIADEGVFVKDDDAYVPGKTTCATVDTYKFVLDVATGRDVLSAAPMVSYGDGSGYYRIRVTVSDSCSRTVWTKLQYSGTPFGGAGKTDITDVPVNRVAGDGMDIPVSEDGLYYIRAVTQDVSGNLVYTNQTTCTVAGIQNISVGTAISNMPSSTTGAPVYKATFTIPCAIKCTGLVLYMRINGVWSEYMDIYNDEDARTLTCELELDAEYSVAVRSEKYCTGDVIAQGAGFNVFRIELVSKSTAIEPAHDSTWTTFTYDCTEVGGVHPAIDHYEYSADATFTTVKTVWPVKVGAETAYTAEFDGERHGTWYARGVSHSDTERGVATTYTGVVAFIPNSMESGTPVVTVSGYHVTYSMEMGTDTTMNEFVIGIEGTDFVKHIPVDDSNREITESGSYLYTLRNVLIPQIGGTYRDGNYTVYAAYAKDGETLGRSNAARFAVDVFSKASCVITAMPAEGNDTMPPTVLNIRLSSDYTDPDGNEYSISPDSFGLSRTYYMLDNWCIMHYDKEALPAKTTSAKNTWRLGIDVEGNMLVDPETGENVFEAFPEGYISSLYVVMNMKNAYTAYTEGSGVERLMSEYPVAIPLGGQTEQDRPSIIYNGSGDNAYTITDIDDNSVYKVKYYELYTNDTLVDTKYPDADEHIDAWDVLRDGAYDGHGTGSSHTAHYYVRAVYAEDENGNVTARSYPSNPVSIRPFQDLNVTTEARVPELLPDEFALRMLTSSFPRVLDESMYSELSYDVSYLDASGNWVKTWRGAKFNTSFFDGYSKKLWSMYAAQAMGTYRFTWNWVDRLGNAIYRTETVQCMANLSGTLPALGLTQNADRSSGLYLDGVNDKLPATIAILYPDNVTPVITQLVLDGRTLSSDCYVTSYDGEKVYITLLVALGPVSAETHTASMQLVPHTITGAAVPDEYVITHSFTYNYGSGYHGWEAPSDISIASVVDNGSPAVTVKLNMPDTDGFRYDSANVYIASGTSTQKLVYNSGSNEWTGTIPEYADNGKYTVMVCDYFSTENPDYVICSGEYDMFKLSDYEYFNDVSPIYIAIPDNEWRSGTGTSWNYSIASSAIRSYDKFSLAPYVDNYSVLDDNYIEVRACPVDGIVDLHPVRADEKLQYGYSEGRWDELDWAVDIYTFKWGNGTMSANGTLDRYIYAINGAAYSPLAEDTRHSKDILNIKCQRQVCMMQIENNTFKVYVLGMREYDKLSYTIANLDTSAQPLSGTVDMGERGETEYDTFDVGDACQLGTGASVRLMLTITGTSPSGASATISCINSFTIRDVLYGRTIEPTVIEGSHGKYTANVLIGYTGSLTGLPYDSLTMAYYVDDELLDNTAVVADDRSRTLSLNDYPNAVTIGSHTLTTVLSCAHGDYLTAACTYTVAEPNGGSLEIAEDSLGGVMDTLNYYINNADTDDNYTVKCYVDGALVSERTSDYANPMSINIENPYSVFTPGNHVIKLTGTCGHGYALKPDEKTVLIPYPTLHLSLSENTDSSGDASSYSYSIGYNDPYVSTGVLGEFGVSFVAYTLSDAKPEIVYMIPTDSQLNGSVSRDTLTWNYPYSGKLELSASGPGAFEFDGDDNIYINPIMDFTVSSITHIVGGSSVSYAITYAQQSGTVSDNYIIRYTVGETTVENLGASGTVDIMHDGDATATFSLVSIRLNEVVKSNWTVSLSAAT